MIRRPRRVLPATLVALVLLAVMVLVVASCVQFLLGQPPLVPFGALAEQGAGLRLNALPVLVAGGVVAVLGLVLLICAWAPGKPDVLPLASGDGQLSAGVTLRSLRHDLNSTAEHVDGISGASTTVTARRIRTEVRTGLRHTDGLADQVRTAVGERLTTMTMQHPPRIVVRVARTRSAR